jgi:allophanate hydrolase
VRASSRSPPLDLVSLGRAYRDGTSTPSEVIEGVLDQIADGADEGIWISRREPEKLREDARSLERRYASAERPPLYGVPFAVKDSIDVAAVPTTAACADFAYVPERSAAIVERLVAAGALYVGKTNLDQFATGLVGVRSPYGIPKNPFDPAYVTGGSSSGSAAAVARGQVSFALATDTAGSGRIPAAFNNIVGLKPSLGLLSTRGLVPACQSIDCMTLLSLTCDDARSVAAIATGFDSADPFSRPEASRFGWRSSVVTQGLRLAVARSEELYFADDPTRQAFASACNRLESMGVVLEEIDMAAFYEAGQLLYGGPWVSERLSGLESFRQQHSESILPVIRAILDDGNRYSATDVFRAIHRLAELRRTTHPLWNRVQGLVLPAAPGHPKIEEVLRDPIGLNARLGRYTTFANLLDMAAVSVPSGMRADGLPSGVTFLGPWGRDAFLLALGAAFHASIGVTLGATGWAHPPAEPSPAATPFGFLPIAVVGAHLSGEPLNHQLIERGGAFLRRVCTAPYYRLYALPETVPPKPGLVRVQQGDGAAIEVEVWALPMDTVGSFIAGVAAPLAIGSIELEDGVRVHGFLCESSAINRARDISSFGGWRAYLRAASSG